MSVFVEVVRRSDDSIVQSMGPMSEEKAARVERGLLINMDRESFFVRVREADASASKSSPR